MKKFISFLSLLIIPFVTCGQGIDAIANDIDTDIVVDTENPTEELIEQEVEGQETENLNNDGEVLKDIDPSDNGLGLIGFGFCNEGTDNLSSSLNYAVTAGKPFKICSLLKNNSNQDITISIRIVDQDLTEDGNKTCNYVSTNIQNFMDKETVSDFEEVVLPAGQYVTKEFEVMFPIGVEGEQKACYTYYIPRETNGGMITAIINKASFMNFFVGGVDNIKNEIILENFSAELDSNKDLNVNFNLSNVGNLEDTIEIKGTISNIFGFKKEFTIEGKGIQLKPGDTIPVSALLGSLPAYGGLFKITFNVNSTPFFSYDISNSSINPELLESKVFTVTTSYFQMPWLILVVILLIIVILILAFKKPKNKQPQVVYVQVPQQPQSQPQIPQQ